MKKIISYVLMSVVAAAAVALTSCKQDETTGETRLLNLYLTPVQSLVEVGDTTEVVVLATYSNGDVKDVTADAKIELVSGNCVTVKEGTGKVAGISVGEATISATYAGLNDKASVISSKVQKLIITANSDAGALMFPLDTLVKGEGFVVEAILEPITEGGATYKKALDADDYEITVGTDECIALEDDAVIAKEPGKGDLYARYKDNLGTVNVYVAEIDTIKFHLDVDIFSDNADVVMLGSIANVVATADYVWEDEDIDSTATDIDISAKLIVNAKTPSILGVSGTSVSALQLEDDAIYSIFRTTETKDTLLERKVCVLNEKDLHYDDYSIELADSAFYDEIQYKYYANCFRAKGDDTTRFQVDLTGTQNDSIQVYFATCGKIFTTPFGNYGKLDRMQLDMTKSEGNCYSFDDTKDHRFQIAVVYNFDNISSDTVFSKPFDIYNEPGSTINNDSVFIYVDQEWHNPCVFHNDYKVADDLGHDLTDKITYTKHSWTDSQGNKRVGLRASIPSIYAKGRKITVFYGPGDESVEWDFSKKKIK